VTDTTAVNEKKTTIVFQQEGAHQAISCTMFVDVKEGIFGIRRVNETDSGAMWTIPLADVLEVIRKAV